MRPSEQEFHIYHFQTDDDSGSTSSAGKGRSQYFPTHRSGKILSMRLKNFMCHRNLSVDFNRQTNLIVGKNGSGKSAILTALIIGLGSKANATDRSHNIKRKQTHFRRFRFFFLSKNVCN